MRPKTFQIWPTKEQYLSWSLPSKLTFWSFVIGLISLIIGLLTWATSLSVKKTLEIDIEGAWNRQIAEEIVLKKLQNFGGVEDFGFDQNSAHDVSLVHQVIDCYSVNYLNKETYVIAIYTIPQDYECHACVPQLSVFEFVAYDRGWKLERTAINATQIGAYGLPPDIIRVMPIGHNIFGLVIEHGYLGQGYYSGYTVIYAFVGQEFKEVFCLVTEENGEGSIAAMNGEPISNWSSKIKVNKEGSSFYDLEVASKGKKEGRAFESNVLYKFDGIKYSPSRLFR